MCVWGSKYNTEQRFKTLSILNILLTRSTVQPDGNPGIPAPCSFNKNCLFHHSTRAVARSYY